ncbi:MAG: hypothetical protein QXF21_04070 [Thermoproteota archaeon]
MEEKVGEKKDGKFSRAKRKYLVTWTLTLSREDMAAISRRPEALDKAFNYLKSLVKDSGFEIYRFVAMDELTRRMRPMTEARISGIAILDADSLEDAREIINEWVAGLTYGGTPIVLRDYLDYEIKPLAELGLKGRE